MSFGSATVACCTRGWGTDVQFRLGSRKYDHHRKEDRIWLVNFRQRLFYGYKYAKADDKGPD